MKFEYIYDFGASTEMLSKVISAREGFAQDKAVLTVRRASSAHRL